jgi:hypothetical protein
VRGYLNRHDAAGNSFRISMKVVLQAQGRPIRDNSDPNGTLLDLSHSPAIPLASVERFCHQTEQSNLEPQASPPSLTEGRRELLETSIWQGKGTMTVPQ